MEVLVLAILFIVIVAFLYSLWNVEIKEEKKEIKDLYL
jgi:hypothetical protein